MYNTNALLLKDFYKAVHSEMIPKGMTKSVSYFTPRMSRVNRWTHVVNFGLQAFIKTWLIDYFNKNFFCKPIGDVVNEYKRYMEKTLGEGVCDFEKIKKLHQLSYLPIEIVSLPEGVLVPMHCPIFGVTNTHPDFAWLGQALESLISAELWYPMVCATVGHSYREVVNKYYEKTCNDFVPRKRALGNFDFRGDQGVDAALKAGSAWCLSFVNTATVPVIPYLEDMYNVDICKGDEVGFGAVSTEHFVMCSNSAFDIAANPDEDENGLGYEFKDIDPYRERVFIKRALTELYPNTSFSCVCDSYDYWNVVDNILPTLKEEILAHNGCFLVRGDSGDCVKVVTETVFKLWNIFGGSINNKGYKVLDPHVKALYGDSITIQRAEEIYDILEKNGFAACNVSLGVGSFSMHCIEEDGMLKPFTRDTFSMAIKAVYAEFKDENGNIKKMPIFKDPKTDRENGGGNFKKSQRGCCIVTFENGDYKFTDGHTWDEAVLSPNLMRTVFRDGELIEPDNLNNIRQRLNNFNF